MNDNEVLSVLVEIFKDTLDSPSIVLSAATTAKDVDGWDSLSHIQLIVAIEKKFKIRFTANEIQKWKNVGEMMASIKQKAS